MPKIKNIKAELYVEKKLPLLLIGKKAINKLNIIAKYTQLEI